jgi:hypothetical protein
VAVRKKQFSFLCDFYLDNNQPENDASEVKQICRSFQLPHLSPFQEQELAPYTMGMYRLPRRLRALPSVFSG